MNTRRDFLAQGAALALAGTLAPHAGAQTAHRLFVGFPPGGSADLSARALAEPLRMRTGSPWIVENRPGAGGRLAIMGFKDLPGDGGTLLITPSPMVTMYPHTYRKLAYDPLVDLVPVSSVARFSYALAVGPAVPPEVRTVEQLGAWAKLRAANASFGTPGAGSTPQMAGVVLSQALKVSLQQVPYKGGSPMVADLMGGQVPMGITVLSDVLPAVAAGKLRALAVTGASRSAHLGAVPTFREAGIEGLDFNDWVGVFLPRQAAAREADSLNSAVREALGKPEVAQIFAKSGLELGGESRAEFAQTVRRDYERWAPIVAASGFTAED